jgi:glutathione S-transferase
MITFYYGSGSPYAWRVWLALEHKNIAYDLKRIAFDKAEHKTPEFLALNPRGRVPAIIDDGFTLAESLVILEYLEDKYPQNPLFSKDIQTKAKQRLALRELDEFITPHSRVLFEAVVMQKGDPKPAIAALKEEYAKFENLTIGEISHVHYSLFSLLALHLRLAKRVEGFTSRDMISEKLENWFDKTHAMPIIEKTYPPHWKG